MDNPKWIIFFVKNGSTYGKDSESIHYEGLCPSAALDDILLMNEVQFAETLSMLTENQKRVLAAIAAEVRVKRVNTAEFLVKYKLPTASAVNVETRGLKGVSSGRANIFRSYFDMGLK